MLSIISRATFDLAKVLNTVLELGARLSKADKGVILRAAWNASYYAAATYRHTPEFIESQKGILFEPGRSGVVGRVLLEGKSVQIADVFDDPEYAYREFARSGGFRTILGVPLLREGSPIGLFVLPPAVRSPTSRSSWSRPLPIKPSSPSRTRSYSTNCASAPPTSQKHWNSRRLRQRCCKSSARSLAHSKQSSIPC